MWAKRLETKKDGLQSKESGGMSKLKASKLYNIPRTTLLRRLKTMDLDSPATKATVLAIKDEEALVGHILRMEERGFGLTITDVRKLAYEIAVRSGRKHCFNNDKKSAGYDWWQCFRDRHPCSSVRIQEGLSAARSSMLNPNVISAYFQKLGSFMDKLNIKDKPQQIFNADETGVSTVHDPSKAVGKRGQKSVHSKTSGERGENVTALCCVNAEARVLPPMLIFKGQRVSQTLMGNAPAKTLFACI
ncbi:jerky protein homolog-like [Mytilus edulis]|uniref:jerky protein homolog-like n=1 Tax=Mytilus edulis TaxID=6550 RepID=UPI0039F045AA